MFKVRGTLASGKAFKFDANAGNLTDAVTELNSKLTAAGVEPNTVTRVAFSTRATPQAELALTDVKKRERKPTDKKKK